MDNSTAQWNDKCSRVSVGEGFFFFILFSFFHFCSAVFQNVTTASHMTLCYRGKKSFRFRDESEIQPYPFTWQDLVAQ